MDRYRIVLLHATPVAMQPIDRALATLWPEVEPVHLLDESLSADRAREGDILSEALTERFIAFGRYAERLEPRGILTTCSAFGPAIERLTEIVGVPVVKPNEAMFRAALAMGNNIAMLATFAPAVTPMHVEFNAMARGTPARLTAVVVSGAIEELQRGNVANHNRLVAAAAADLSGFDAVMLAQFSTSSALADVRDASDLPVFSAPESAVRCLQEKLASKRDIRGPKK